MALVPAYLWIGFARREPFAFAWVPICLLYGLDPAGPSRTYELTYAAAYGAMNVPLGRPSIEWHRVRRIEFFPDRLVLHASPRETLWNRGGGVRLDLPDDPALCARIGAAVRTKCAAALRQGSPARHA